MATSTNLEIKRLSLFPLSWMARIKIVKILLLPRFLYISRAIPYRFPSYLVAKIQNLFLKFIWNDSKPCFKKQYLFMPKQAGGLSVPNLTYYNLASILESVYILVTPLPFTVGHLNKTPCVELLLTIYCRLHAWELPLPLLLCYL